MRAKHFCVLKTAESMANIWYQVKSVQVPPLVN